MQDPTVVQCFGRDYQNYVTPLVGISISILCNNDGKNLYSIKFPLFYYYFNIKWNFLFIFFPVKSPIFVRNPIFLTKCLFPRHIFPKSPILVPFPIYIYSYPFYHFYHFIYWPIPQKVPFWQGTHFFEKHHLICPESPISNKMILSQTVFPRSPILAQILYFYPRIPFGHTPFSKFESPIWS